MSDDVGREVLIVDDDEAIRKILKMRLMREHIPVVEAASGSDAIRLLNERDFRAVILDIHLGDMNGRDLLEKMRDASRVVAHRTALPRALPRLIILSGEIDLGESMAAEYGDEAVFLPKPFNAEQILEAITGERVSSATGAPSIATSVLSRDKPERDKPERKMPATPDEALEGEDVLVVEDTADIATLLSLRLAKSGYRPRVAATLAGAYAEFKKKIPEIVLLDLGLPDGNGQDFLISIRANPKTRELPVVILSAYASSDQIEESFIRGANSYISKPYAQKDLLSCIKMLLTEAQAHKRSALPSKAVGLVK